MNEADQVVLNFSEGSLLVLNICLAFVMFGVALSLKVDDFKRVVSQPKGSLTGLFSQFILLPALTFCLILILRPQPSFAFGMMLVAACPGGNISNFMSLMAKGNAALSVSLTAAATLLTLVMTPFNLAFWASLYPPTAELLQEVSLEPGSLIKTVFLLLGIPLTLGMLFAHFFPRIASRINGPIRTLSILIFLAFVVIAFANNFEIFLQYIGAIFLLVLVHNALAFGGGYGIARIMRLPDADVRAISIETGIQNSGLGLVLIFNFFNGLGGMAMIAAWWGIWHILSGLGVAYFWSRK